MFRNPDTRRGDSARAQSERVAEHPFAACGVVPLSHQPEPLLALVRPCAPCFPLPSFFAPLRGTACKMWTLTARLFSSHRQVPEDEKSGSGGRLGATASTVIPTSPASATDRQGERTRTGFYRQHGKKSSQLRGVRGAAVAIPKTVVLLHRCVR